MMKCFSRSTLLRRSKLSWALTFVLFLHYIQGCFSIQSFKEEPSYTEVNPGDNTELRCVVNDIGGECRWQKDGKPIGLHAGKYEWAGRAAGGDCSFKIKEVNIEFDDGLWECQVTSSTFQAQDALASKPARLVVREPPTSFAIIRNKKPVVHGGQITVVDGKAETVTCESRESNPAPELKWFLGDKELTPSVQNNETELNDTRRWRSYSTLEHIFTLNDFGKLLTCRVYHPAYVKSPQESSVSLDLLYKPKVSISRLADDVLEEGKSAITLTCGADANPPARIFWRKLGSAEERRFVESLEFNPTQRKDSGTYVCQAENSIGVSKEEAAEVNILYPPKILRVTPTGGATIGVHNRSILTCSAEGNPLPKYQWLQKLPSQQVVKRGFEDKLIITGTSYNDQGEYVCEAVNVIDGRRNTVQSGPVRMEVRGAPQVLRRSAAQEVDAVSGRDVQLEMDVCSDPIPSKSTWNFEGTQVEVGKDVEGRFIADQMIEHPNKEDCYIARLLVRNVSPEDSKKYFLAVENIHGEDRYAVSLNVKDPVSMASVISVVIVLLVLFVVIVIALLFLYKTQRLCFKDDSKLDKCNAESMNDKLDPEMMGRANPGMKGSMKNGGGNMNGNGHHPLPPDGMYHVSDGNGHGITGFNGTMTNGMDNGNALAAALTDKLWPENPTYQVYIPGFHSSTSMMAHPNGAVAMTPQSYINGSTTSINRARSVSPNQNGYGHVGTLSSYPQGNPERPLTSTTSRIQYAELQFPVASNYGSMKKKSKREHKDSTNTTASTSVNSSGRGGSGDPSPSSNMMMSLEGGDGYDGHKESQVSMSNHHMPQPSHNTTQSTIASAQSINSVHRYVPDYVAISNRKTAV